jgi:preprotein translocase subunit SecG
MLFSSLWMTIFVVLALCVVTVVVLVVFTLDHRSKSLNSPDHSSATASFLGRMPSSLPVLVAFTFARN